MCECGNENKRGWMESIAIDVLRQLAFLRHVRRRVRVLLVAFATGPYHSH